MARAQNDPQTMEAQGYDSRSTPSAAWLRRHIKSDPFGAVVGVVRDTDRPVGWTSLGRAPFGPGSSAWSLGLTLDPTCRGHGYGRVVLTAGILVGREQASLRPGPPELFVGTAVSNTAMQHMMQQLGYEADPGTRPYLAPNGKTIESLWYRCGPTTNSPITPSVGSN